MRRPGKRPPWIAKAAALEAKRVETAAFLGEEPKPKSKPKRKRAVGISDGLFVKDLEAAAEMLAKEAWSRATGRHFVALYADLHFRVYGVAPTDMGSKERAWAAGMANRMLAKEFGGSRQEMARFIAWTWSREKEREQWRRESGRAHGRIDYRLQFGPRLLVDFRIEIARKKAGS